MKMSSITFNHFSFPGELVKAHYCEKVPADFQCLLHGRDFGEKTGKSLDKPTLFTGQLPEILEWLHGLERPGILEVKPYSTSLLLHVEAFSFESLLFHYQGTPESAQLIKRFVDLFEMNIRTSRATIISPGIIPKSKIKEEQKLIQMVTQATSETSFIKFNFNGIGDFCSYAVKHECTLFITTKKLQADLIKVLFKCSQEGGQYGRLSFYLAI